MCSHCMFPCAVAYSSAPERAMTVRPALPICRMFPFPLPSMDPPCCFGWTAPGSTGAFRLLSITIQTAAPTPSPVRR